MKDSPAVTLNGILALSLIREDPEITWWRLIILGAAS